ncbi:MAG: hypothetical protein J0L92_07025 [Deltaproteobacteria bacterium]|nr:hypothetical protein [Deltaproteobacteria bacterium]
MSSAQPLLRFLGLVERELHAETARIELSAHEPAPEVVWAPMAHGFRVVVSLSGAYDPVEARARLVAIVDSFSGVLAETVLPAVREAPQTAIATLEEALDLLAHRARAESAWVIDDSTPEIWGGSLPHEGLDVARALRVDRLARAAERGEMSLAQLVALDDRLRATLAERGFSPAEAKQIEHDLEELPRTLPDGALLRMLRTLAAVRSKSQSPDPSFTRRFAGIYELVLVFSGPYSELHAEAAVLRALPLIERLVTSLPPRDPVATGAKVAVLRRLRRV